MSEREGNPWLVLLLLLHLLQSLFLFLSIFYFRLECEGMRERGGFGGFKDEDLGDFAKRTPMDHKMTHYY